MAVNDFSTTLNGQSRIYFGTATPTSGNDPKQGDWLIITNPSTGNPFLYVCTASASGNNGGTWRAAGGNL